MSDKLEEFGKEFLIRFLDSDEGEEFMQLLRDFMKLDYPEVNNDVG